MEHKIVYLTWAGNYAVMSRTEFRGWVYIAKYISKEEAEKLLEEVME